MLTHSGSIIDGLESIEQQVHFRQLSSSNRQAQEPGQCQKDGNLNQILAASLAHQAGATRLGCQGPGVAFADNCCRGVTEVRASAQAELLRDVPVYD